MSDEEKAAAETAKRVEELKAKWLKLDAEQKALAAEIPERQAARETLIKRHGESVAALQQQIAALNAKHAAELVAADAAIKEAKEKRVNKKEAAGDASYLIQRMGETWPPRE